MSKILTAKQLEIVDYFNSKYGIDITKNWFTFSIDNEYAEEEGYNFWVCIQPEEGFDCDPMAEYFLPKSIQLDNMAEVTYGYDGKLSKEDFIKELEQTGFFKNEQ
jgi:hypothetical protein